MGWWKESGQAVAKLTNLGRSRTWACMRRREVGRGRCRVGWAAVEAGEGGGVVATGKRRRWIGDDGSKAAGGVPWCFATTQGRGNHDGGEKGVKRGSMDANRSRRCSILG
jgi:hypothetical protein